MRTASLTTIWASLQRVGRLHGRSASARPKPGVEVSQPGDGIEDVLGLLGHAFAPLCILFLHLADGLLLACPDLGQIDLGNGRQGAIEAGGGVGDTVGRTEQLKGQDVGKGYNVVVAGLGGERGKSGVDGDGIGDVAGGEEGALEHVVVGRTGYLDAGQESASASSSSTHGRQRK